MTMEEAKGYCPPPNKKPKKEHAGFPSTAAPYPYPPMFFPYPMGLMPQHTFPTLPPVPTSVPPSLPPPLPESDVSSE